LYKYIVVKKEKKNMGQVPRSVTCSDWRGLRIDNKGWCMGTLMLRFIVTCGSGRGAVSIEDAGDVDKAGGIVIEVAVAIAGGVDSVSNGGGLRGVRKVVGCVDGIVAGAAVVVVNDGAVVDGKIIVIDIVVAVATAGIVNDAAVADFVAVVDIDGVGVFNVRPGF